MRMSERSVKKQNTPVRQLSPRLVPALPPIDTAAWWGFSTESALPERREAIPPQSLVTASPIHV